VPNEREMIRLEVVRSLSVKGRMVVFIFFLLQFRRALETGSDNSGRLSRAAPPGRPLHHRGAPVKIEEALGGFKYKPGWTSAPHGVFVNGEVAGVFSKGPVLSADGSGRTIH
jgi:hypothetical protein